MRKLADLVRPREDLLERLQQEKNRQEQTSVDKTLHQSLRRVVRLLQKEIARIQKQITQHIKTHPRLQADAQLLESIAGISALTAQKILAELGGDARRFTSSCSAAAYAGLAPKEHNCGASVRKKSVLSKQGNPYLRKALYFPTVTALTRSWFSWSC